MKKTVILSYLLLATLTVFCSCSKKKNYTCKCTTTISGKTTTTETALGNDESSAGDECSSLENEANATNPGSTTCALE